jgi:hypothetical protein
MTPIRQLSISLGSCAFRDDSPDQLSQRHAASLTLALDCNPYLSYTSPELDISLHCLLICKTLPNVMIDRPAHPRNCKRFGLTHHADCRQRLAATGGRRVVASAHSYGISIVNTNRN